MKYYKFLTSENKGAYSDFDYTDYLPKDGQPGKWLPKVEDLELCESGYHACTRKDVLRWVNTQMYEVELRGKKKNGNEKVVAQEMRFIRKVDYNERILRLFACWCAEQVLPNFENKYPEDKRPRQAIETAKRYADGKATKKELSAANSAARSAADSAARSAANSAAYYAARSAANSAAYFAAYFAADSAAYFAADSAADSAAYFAADSAATKNQSDKFMEMVGE